MSENKALLARLIQNPDVVKSLPNALPNALKDPQALAQLAGLDGDKRKALTGLGKTLSGLVGLTGKRAGCGASPARAARQSSSSAGSSSAKNTAVAGVVSLTAVAGAVVVVGTVAAVALSKGSKPRPQGS